MVEEGHFCVRRTVAADLECVSSSGRNMMGRRDFVFVENSDPRFTSCHKFPNLEQCHRNHFFCYFYCRC